MTKMLFVAAVAIALLIASGASAPARAQSPRSAPSAGSIGTSTPSAGRIGTSTPSAGRIGTSTLPTGGIVTSRSFRHERRVFPIRIPWFGIAYVDSAWWYAGDAGGMVPYPVAGRADDGRPIGGLQLDVEPRRALVYVDGWYVGTVEMFSGYFHHLELAAGSHIVEFLAPDYDPLSVEILVTPGRTTTYRGSLNRR